MRDTKRELMNNLSQLSVLTNKLLKRGRLSDLRLTSDHDREVIADVKRAIDQAFDVYRPGYIVHGNNYERSVSELAEMFRATAHQLQLANQALNEHTFSPPITARKRIGFISRFWEAGKFLLSAPLTAGRAAAGYLRFIRENTQPKSTMRMVGYLLAPIGMTFAALFSLLSTPFLALAALLGRIRLKEYRQEGGMVLDTLNIITTKRLRGKKLAAAQKAQQAPR